MEKSVNRSQTSSTFRLPIAGWSGKGEKQNANDEPSIIRPGDRSGGGCLFPNPAVGPRRGAAASGPRSLPLRGEIAAESQRHFLRTRVREFRGRGLGPAV